MVSYCAPKNDASSNIKNCTIASTFEKEKSLKFEILFGAYCQKVIKDPHGADVINAVDYFFSPGQIFGFVYESLGVGFKRFHHAFVLRSCMPGEIGSIIPGISPGAEILVSTLTGVASSRLKTILQKLMKEKIDLVDLGISQYRRLNYVLGIKANTDFLVSELIRTRY